MAHIKIKPPVDNKGNKISNKTRNIKLEVRPDFSFWEGSSLGLVNIIQIEIIIRKIGESDISNSNDSGA